MKYCMISSRNLLDGDWLPSCMKHVWTRCSTNSATSSTYKNNYARSSRSAIALSLGQERIASCYSLSNTELSSK
jgi:hypothetical protein